jgi:hypothetical protein
MDTNKHELIPSICVHWRSFVVKGQQIGALNAFGLVRWGRLAQNMSSQKVNYEWRLERPERGSRGE